MAMKVNQSPQVGFPLNLTNIPAISNFLLNIVQALTGILQGQATTINSIIDEALVPIRPTPFKPYAKAALPSAVTYVNNMIIVTDDVGGLTPAFSDGTNWRRTADRNVIS